MTNIANISANHNIELRKSTRKIYFEKGESFLGKIVGKGEEENSAVVRLQDGWEFEAKLDKPIQYSEDKLRKFEVVGFENGKIKIKVENEQKSVSVSKDSIEEIIKKLDIGLKKDDYEMLKDMIKHEIPLTKENISKIKSFVQFIDNIKSDPLKGEEFIAKYLASRNIDPNSELGLKVVQKLQEFFSELKNLNLEKILTMYENGIELSGENIKSFNSFISEDSKLYKIFNEIRKEVNLKNLNEVNLKNVNEDIKNKEIVLEDNNNIENRNNNVENKEIILDDKNINNKEVNTKDKDVNLKVKTSQTTLKENKFEKISENFIKNVDNKENKILEDNKQTKNLLNIKENKTKIQGKVSEIKNIDISKFFNDGKDIFKTNMLSIDKIIQKLNKVGIQSSKQNVQKVETLINIKTLLNSSENIEKEVVVNYLQKQNIDINSKTGQTMQKNLTKVLDKIKNENIDKLINVLKDNNLVNIILKKDSSVYKFLQQIKNELANESNKLYTPQNIKDQINGKLEQMKNVIKTTLSENLNLKPELASILQNNMNDFKVFNSMSNQYYYLDIPIDMKNSQYNCKLIIKDDRKSGKKIDSKNVKIVATVKTINMGDVDAYIKVFDNSMKVNIKCEDKWIKILSKNKEKISNTLSKIGYDVIIDVSEKQQKVDIVNCREFFEDDTAYGINIKV